MKNKKFKLPNMDYSFNEAANVLPEKKAIMKQSKNNKKQNKVKQIEVNGKLSLLIISKLTAKVMKYDNIDIKFINIKEIDLSGIQFILSLLSSSKNINLDLGVDENTKALMVNTGFNKIL